MAGPVGPSSQCGRRALALGIAGAVGFAASAFSGVLPEKRERELFRLAYSEQLGVEVFALVTEGGWCRKRIELEVRAKDPDLFRSDQLAVLMRRLAVVLNRECPAAEVALLFGTREGAWPPVYEGIANALDGWIPHRREDGAGRFDPAAVRA